MITNPYATLEDDDLARLNIDVSKEDYALIRNMSVSRGKIQAVGAHLWAKLCQRIREGGLTSFQDEETFDMYVNSIKFPTVKRVGDDSGQDDNTIRRRTTQGPVSKTT